MFVLIYYKGDLEHATKKVQEKLECSEIVSTNSWSIACNILNCSGGPSTLCVAGREPGEDIPEGVTVYRVGEEA